MKTIAIQSNKNLMFPPSYQGIVTMRIDLIQNKPEDEVYELRIIDTCHIEELDESTQTMKKNILGQPIIRFKTITYEDIDQLAVFLNVKFGDKKKLRENINELFRQGLLLITQKECSEGQGMYFSQAQDWEILRENEI